jgi:hypothetical protein
MSWGAAPGVSGLVSRIVGVVGMAGAAYYQPMVLEGVDALVLLIVDRLTPCRQPVT